MSEVIDRRVAFNGGEWSPFTDPRLDLEKYRNACRLLRNMRPTVYGGAFSRAGTVFQGEAGSKVRLVEFEFNVTTTLVLEFGDNTLRFWTTGDTPGLVDDPDSPGDPYEVVTPWGEGDIFQLQFAQQNDVVVIVHPDHPPHILTRLASTNDDWSLEEIPIEWPALLDERFDGISLEAAATFGTGVALEASSPLFEDGHVGSYWVIKHRRIDPSVDLALDATAGATTSALFVLGEWTATVEVSTGGTWDSKAVVQRSYDGNTWETLRVVVSNGSVSQTVTGIELEPCFLRLRKVVHTGTPPAAGNFTLQANDPDHYGIVQITSVTDPENATVDIHFPLASTDPTERWQEPAWSGVRGYPRTVSFHEQRLMFAGTRTRPQTIWGSVIDDYYNFRTGSDDDLGLNLTLASDASNAIQWLASQESLVIGTSGSEWVLGARDTTRSLTPSNAAVKRQTNYGSSYLQAKIVQDAVLFVQRNAKRMREFVYTFERDGYSAQDLTLLAEHITQGGVVQMAVQNNPETIVWMVTGEGKLLGLTYERGQNVAGWFAYETIGKFESVAVVSGQGDEDEIWVSVQRVIDGETVRYIERFQPDRMAKLRDKDQPAIVCTDSSVIYEGPSTTTITGLDHLEATEVAVLAGGAPHPNRTVLGGQIELQFEAEKVIVGLPFEAIFSPTWLETNDPNSVTKAFKKRLHRAVIEFWRTLGAEVSGDEALWDTIEFRSPADNMDQAPPLFSGIKEQNIEASSGRQVAITIRQRQPLPLNILSITTRYEVSTA